MKLFDTHAHLTDARYDADRYELIESLKDEGVALAVEIACDMSKVDDAIALMERYSFIYGTVGVHPHDAEGTKKGYLDKISEYLQHDKMLALGEIGLDYYYDNSPRNVQLKVFAQQLELAQQLNLPVVLHIRDAFGDCLDILRAHKNGLKGVMHCYSGSYETARDCIDLGLYIAFGGALTFQNATRLRDVAARLPLERIVIETDCPYLTPAPHRGKRNSPAYVRFVAEKLAEVRNMGAEEIALITYENGKKMYEME